MHMTDQEYVAYMTKHGFRVEPTLTAPTLPSQLDPATPEAQLLTKIRRLALDNGWLFHHVRNSRGCDPGFVDICCVKPGQPLLMAELKSRTGKLTREQEQWLAFLRHAQGVQADLWRPADWPHIQTLLTQR
jgi:hypothetical protein